MNLEVRHLRLVVAIAELGSMTKAGDHLNLTQSALSHQLRDIEERLGSPLFRRLNKKMDLTPAGERLLESARRVLAELQRAEDDLQHVGSERQGVLRLSAECYTCYLWLPKRLKLFVGKYPRLDVHFTTEPTKRSIQALLDGNLDVAIMCTRQPNRRLRYEPLFKDEMVVVMHPSHRLARSPFIRPEDFVDEHVLLNAPSAEDSTIMQQVLLPAGVTPHRVTYVQLTDGVVELVKSGLGIGVLARWSVLPEIESGAIHAAPLTRKGFMRPWHAVMTRSSSAPSYFMEFVRLLAEHPLTADGR
ncbi:MAG TPA: LysR family transcriptional regulator [Terriglobia bacterium]|nr:LysR family transcriptional regulator [Terriglobia bacterium]